jgi:formylglycine-generating enzyme required for sulfatase activity
MPIVSTRSNSASLVLLAAASVLAACGLVASGIGADGGADVPDASLDARGDASGGDGPGGEPDTGTVDGGADAREGGCPVGLPGPALVQVGDYCIDATEVTQAQFEAFLSATLDAGTPPAPCNWATGSETYRSYMPSDAGGNRPAVGMNWCGAYQYCLWAKKRLCGKRGGGPLGASTNDATDSTKSEWFNACSKGGTQTFPYGAAYSSNACNAGTGQVADVGAYATCEGGYAGLYDMVGNVLEWQDACETGGQPKDQNCILQGASFFNAWDTEPERRCSTIDFNNDTERGDRWDDVGFRCCANVE